jgi:hypothetical protein
MKLIGIVIIQSLLLALFPINSIAQTEQSHHPKLADTFSVGVGVFFPDKNFKVRVDGRLPGDYVDFEEAFKIDDSETTGAFDFRWRFGEKWSVQGQYWSVSDSGTARLTEDYVWDDVVFKEGTFASADLGLDVARVFFGRTFSSSPRHEFGLGLGFHWLELEAGIEGQILTDQGDSEFYRGDVSSGAPLPNIGAWYMHSWSEQWAFLAQVDWLSATIGDYSGSLWNAQLGVNWAVFEHFGIGASWNFFQLDVDIDKSDWRGAAEVSQNGPFLSLTAYW